jgi:hypothetical protein
MAAIIFLSITVAVTEADSFDWSGKISQGDAATLLSGFGGAALGGLVSWILAKQAGKETLRRDMEQRTAHDKSMALAVMLKTQQIANGLYTVKKYFYQSRRRANLANRISRPMWETTKPVISTTPSRLRYDPSEFGPLVAAQRPDLVDRCTLLALRYEVTETIINDYSTRRGTLHDLLAPHSQLSGADGLVITSVPPALRNVYTMKGKELEDIIRALFSSVLEDSNEAHNLCLELSKVFRDHFGEDVYRLEISTEAENQLYDNPL